MPAERDRMDGNERFRHLVNNANPKMLGALLTELGKGEAKKLIDECYRNEPETALISVAKKAGDGSQSKDEALLECCKILIKHGAGVNEVDITRKTALHWACGHKNIALVKLLLDADADTMLRDNQGSTPLLLAVTANSNTCAEVVLKKNKEAVLFEDDNGVTPVLAAVQKGDLKLLNLLVSAGGDLNAQEKSTKRTPLHYALYLKKKEHFQFLLNNGADLTKTDHRGTNIVHRCCAVNDPSYLQQVLALNSETTKKALQMDDSEGATPVIVACQNGNIEQLRLLVENGAPVANKDKFRRCALHHCVENTDTECAQYLLRTIPSLLNCADEEGLTPLHMAVIAGNIPLIQLLLKRGASLTAVDNEKHTVAHWATVCGHADVLDVLLENGADVSTPDRHHAFPIHYAAQMMNKKGSGTESGGTEGNIQLLKTLLKNKVSSEAEDKDKRTPIIWAASAGSIAACRILVDHGADVNRADKDDLTALHCAASRGHADCVEALIKKCKADVDPVDKNQCTPLFYATTLGHGHCVRTLLALGADVTHTDTRGRTAAHCATVSGCTDTLEILRQHKVDLWARNLKGDQPLHEAAQSGHLEVVQYLLSHAGTQKSAIDNSNNDGRTCLHIAALTNNVWMCKLLMERKANVNAMMRNKGKYYTPYDAALIKGHTEAKELLLNQGGKPAAEVITHAAQTIQVGYLYHKKRKDEPDKNKEKTFKSQRTKSRRKPSKEQSSKSSPKKFSPEKDSVDADKASTESEQQKSSETTTEKASQDSSEKATQDSPERVIPAVVVNNSETEIPPQEEKAGKEAQEAPIYVERSTQVTASVLNEELGKPPPKSSQTGNRTKDSKSSVSEKESTKTESTDQSETKSRLVNTSTQSDSPKSDDKHTKVGAGTVASEKHSQEKESEKRQHRQQQKQQQRAKERQTSSDRSEDEETRSELSSSHGNVSDFESSSSDIVRKTKVVRKSPEARSARFTFKQKFSGKQLSKRNNKKPPPVSNHKQQSDSRTSHSKSSSASPQSAVLSKEADGSNTTDRKQTVAPLKSPRKDYGSDSSQALKEKSADEISLNKATVIPPISSDKHGSLEGTESQNTKSQKSPRESSQEMGAENGKTHESGTHSESDAQSPRKDGNATDVSKSSSKSSKKSPKNKKKSYSSSSDAVHLDSDQHEAKSDDTGTTSDKRKSQAEEDCGYTDFEEDEENKGQTDEPSPRKKKTRPNKLILSIQESVRRYEKERRSIMQLHQIRRAQIYSGPGYDVALFKKIVNNAQNKQNTNGETRSTKSNAETWEEYLREQMRIIQEERRAAAHRRPTSPHQRTPKDSGRSGQSHSPMSARRKREQISVDYNGRGVDNKSSKEIKETGKENKEASKENKEASKENKEASKENKEASKEKKEGSKESEVRDQKEVVSADTTSTNQYQRAQSARPMRAQTAPLGRNRQYVIESQRSGTRDSRSPPEDDDASPQRYNSRAMAKLRQEEYQRKLLKAYKPFGGSEIFNQTPSSTRPTTREAGRPTSTMSSKTANSASSTASFRRSRASGYTIMTSYGTRRIRRLPEADERSTDHSEDNSRKRNPLIFHHPDEYDRMKKQERASSSTRTKQGGDSNENRSAIGNNHSSAPSQ